MAIFTHKLACGVATFIAATTVSYGQANTAPVPIPSSVADLHSGGLAPLPSTPSPLTEKPVVATTAPIAPVAPKAEVPEQPMTIVQASTAASGPVTSAKPSTAAVTGAPAGPGATPDAVVEGGGVGVREFQGDDVGQVLRLLARQAKINMVVSEQVQGTVTMRLEDVSALEAIAIIVKAKGLFMDQIDKVYYIKTAAEKTAEPTESDSYTFSYSRAKDVAPLLASQLSSKDAPQVDERTNTIFFRETRSNIDNVRKMLVQIDRPTKQVMIEARLVEVTANPRQSFGINWAGVLGSSTSAQTFTYGGSNFPTAQGYTAQTNAAGQIIGYIPNPNSPPTYTQTFTNGVPNLNNFVRGGSGFGSLFGQVAILSIPQMSVTLRALNEDADAEFLANPRIVTADNQQAKIEISRAQPVPQLNFNEQTATAVFGGFQDKKYGNTLIVRPSVNKDNFVTLNVKPEISNKVGDSTFVFAGATVASPIIDTRSLESNVLIRSGDTLAIGGLLQDEVTKGRTKVPLLGDIPGVGYLFQERLNARTKRNLLVFVTPTIIDSKYGTGLEDQVSGLHHVGEEYADINGWRNNAKGAIRLVPTANRQVVADYPKPGTPPPPAVDANDVEFKSSAKDRDF